MSDNSTSTGRALTIALCFSVALLEGFDIQALGIAAPRLAPELGLDPAQMGMVFAITNVGLVIGAAFGGWIADRVGRKRVLVASAAVFGVFTLSTVIAHSFEALFAARLMAGLGFGAALPNMMALAADVSPTQGRAFTASAMFCGMPIGAGASALVAQLLPPDFSWRALFLVGGALPLVLVPALAVLLRETPRPPVDRNAGDSRKESVLHVLFGDHRAVPTLLLWLAFFPTLLMLYLMLNWLPFIVAAGGLESAIAASAALVFNLGAAAGALIIAALVDRIGMRLPLTMAYAGLIASLFALSAAETATSILLLSGLTGFLILGANYALYGIATCFYPASMRGTGAGASIAVGRIGSVVGPLLAGMWLAHGATGGQVIVYLVPTVVVAGLAVFILSYAKRAD
ncbi:MAG: 3-(3-hydroxy-phenyl)propionate transporter MhpT [Pseudomonadota bacterium]